MASIKTRGPKDARRFYVAHDVDRTPSGKRIQRTNLLKGVTTLADARQEVARVEREVAPQRRRGGLHGGRARPPDQRNHVPPEDRLAIRPALTSHE